MEFPKQRAPAMHPTKVPIKVGPRQKYLLFLTVTIYLTKPPSPPPSAFLMSASGADFAELLNLLAANDQRRGVLGDLSLYLSRLGRSGAPASNPHSHDESEETDFPFTFKQMIHSLYDVETWTDKVKDLIEESKSRFKPLPEELKTPRRHGRCPSGEEGSQVRTVKKRCTGRTHVPDPIFVPKPTYVSHHTRASVVDLQIEGGKSDVMTSPTKRRPSQSRATRPTVNTGARRPRHRSLTQLDTRPRLWDQLTPVIDSRDTEFVTLVTPAEAEPTSALPALKVPKRSNTTLTLPDTLTSPRKTGRVRSSSFGGKACFLVSPIFEPFEPDGE